MRLGTRSILYGIHQPLWHGPTVWWAYYKLYGREAFSLPVIVACFVHDLGYWGCYSMDGQDGIYHPYLGARIMHKLFDTREPESSFGWGLHPCGLPKLVFSKFDPSTWTLKRGVWLVRDRKARVPKEGRSSVGHSKRHDWYDFTLLHSRSLAKKLHCVGFSKLAVADKLAIAITPRWFYILVTTLTGEIAEYKKEFPVQGLSSWEWLTQCQAKMLKWCAANRWVPA